MIAAGAQLLGLTLPEAQMLQLATHCATLAYFNPRLNLTSLTGVESIVSELVLDSLLLLKLQDHIQASRVVDVGSGGGFPGIPLAIAQPAWSVELLERKASIALFLEEAVRRAKVLNATVLNIPLEQYEDPEAGRDRLLFTAKAVFHVEQYCRLLETHAPKTAQAAYWGTPNLDPSTLPNDWQILATAESALPFTGRQSAVYLLSRE